MFVIDVSENNNQIDWDAIVESGVEGVIVRVGYGVSGIEDSMYRENVQAARDHGLHVGAYWYSYALDEDGAAQEGAHCRRIIDEEGGALDLPVWFDMEDADHYKERHNFAFDPDQITAMCQQFIDNLGLNCGVYASRSWFDSYIDWQSLGCSVWNAEWDSGDFYGMPEDESGDSFNGYAWQFTEKLFIGGKQFDGDIFRV